MTAAQQFSMVRRSWRWAPALVIGLSVFHGGSIAHAQRVQVNTVAKGEELYYAGNYEEALFVLEELAADSEASKEQQVAALKLVAFSYFLLGAKDQAGDAWKRLLRHDPTFKLDPVMESPDFVEFFNAIEPPPPEPAKEGGEVIEATDGEGGGGPDAENFVQTAEENVRGCGVALCLIPVGVGQYANGHIVKGIIFSVLEVAFLATNIGLWAANQGDIVASDSNGRPVYRDLKTAQDRYVAQIVFFSLAVLTPIIGIVDAFVFWD